MASPQKPSTSNALVSFEPCKIDLTNEATSIVLFGDRLFNLLKNRRELRFSDIKLDLPQEFLNCSPFVFVEKLKLYFHRYFEVRQGEYCIRRIGDNWPSQDKYILTMIKRLLGSKNNPPETPLNFAINTEDSHIPPRTMPRYEINFDLFDENEDQSSETIFHDETDPIDILRFLMEREARYEAQLQKNAFKLNRFLCQKLNPIEQTCNNHSNLLEDMNQKIDRLLKEIDSLSNSTHVQYGNSRNTKNYYGPASKNNPGSNENGNIARFGSNSKYSDEFASEYHDPKPQNVRRGPRLNDQFRKLITNHIGKNAEEFKRLNEKDDKSEDMPEQQPNFDEPKRENDTYCSKNCSPILSAEDRDLSSLYEAGDNNTEDVKRVHSPGESYQNKNARSISQSSCSRTIANDVNNHVALQMRANEETVIDKNGNEIRRDEKVKWTSKDRSAFN